MARSKVTAGAAQQSKPRKRKTEGGKLSLYPLSIEEAIKAALQTGRAPPLKPNRANRQRKKQTKAPDR